VYHLLCDKTSECKAGKKGRLSTITRRSRRKKTAVSPQGAGTGYNDRKYSPAKVVLGVRIKNRKKTSSGQLPAH